jgi:hypothetical protein
MLKIARINVVEIITRVRKTGCQSIHCQPGQLCPEGHDIQHHNIYFWHGLWQYNQRYWDTPRRSFLHDSRAIKGRGEVMMISSVADDIKHDRTGDRRELAYKTR